VVCHGVLLNGLGPLPLRGPTAESLDVYHGSSPNAHDSEAQVRRNRRFL
jgi:hypothetical protein